MTRERVQTQADGLPIAALGPLATLLVVAAGVLVPIFAHGCHGDDVDHEPGIGPPFQSAGEPGTLPNEGFAESTR